MIHYGTTYNLVYEDMDCFDHIPLEKCRQVYGICFSADIQTLGKIILGKGKSGSYNLIGGTIETGESIETALAREVQEESNTLLLSWLPIGAQYVKELDFYQLRTVCLVKAIGPFESDPAGSVSAIEYIEVGEFNKLINWGKIGKRLLKRAIAKKSLLK